MFHSGKSQSASNVITRMNFWLPFGGVGVHRGIQSAFMSIFHSHGAERGHYEFVSQYLSGLLAILGFAIEHAVCEERAPYGAYLKSLALQVDSDFWNLSFQ